MRLDDVAEGMSTCRSWKTPKGRGPGAIKNERVSGGGGALGGGQSGRGKPGEGSGPRRRRDSCAQGAWELKMRAEHIHRVWQRGRLLYL